MSTASSWRCWKWSIGRQLIRPAVAAAVDGMRGDEGADDAPLPRSFFEPEDIILYQIIRNRRILINQT